VIGESEGGPPKARLSSSQLELSANGMKFDIITIFPDFFRGPLEHGIVRRAQAAAVAEIKVHDLRELTHDRHRTVDDRPFGGGEGMVLKPDPIFDCVAKLGHSSLEERASRQTMESVVLLSPQGQRFDQNLAQGLSTLDRLTLICGRYEGVDERVTEFLADRELSIGDYVLSGGELAAAVIIDAVTRLLPGAVGNEASVRQESFVSGPGTAERAIASKPQQASASASGAKPGPSSTCDSGGLLDYPHYTRPADFRGMKVPEVLVSGDHEQIRRWRRQAALKKTARNRPDLLQGVALTEEDREFLAQLTNGNF